MRRTLCLVVVSSVWLGLSLAHGGDPSDRNSLPYNQLNPNGIPYSEMGGLVFIRQGNQTTWSLGGVFLPRKVKVTTKTPEGPVVTRFTMPSLSHDPDARLEPRRLTSLPATMQVTIPDSYGQIYIEDQLVRTSGTMRVIQSPPLQPGMSYPLRLSAVFMVGDKILVENKRVVLRGGQTLALTFDGSQGRIVRR